MGLINISIQNSGLRWCKTLPSWKKVHTNHCRIRNRTDVIGQVSPHAQGIWLLPSLHCRYIEEKGGIHLYGDTSNEQ